MKTYPMWIGNSWVPAQGGATRDIINPTTGSVLAKVAEATAADVRRAVDQARSAFDSGPWTKMTALERGKILFKIAEGIRGRAEELARTDSLNMGKPIVEAEFDVNDAANCFEYSGGLATKIHGDTL